LTIKPSLNIREFPSYSATEAERTRQAHFKVFMFHQIIKVTGRNTQPRG
jgi:hypothetical protein